MHKFRPKWPLVLGGILGQKPADLLEQDDGPSVGPTASVGVLDLAFWGPDRAFCVGGGRRVKLGLGSQKQ